MARAWVLPIYYHHQPARRRKRRTSRTTARFVRCFCFGWLLPWLGFMARVLPLSIYITTRNYYRTRRRRSRGLSTTYVGWLVGWLVDYLTAWALPLFAITNMTTGGGGRLLGRGLGQAGGAAGGGGPAEAAVRRGRRRPRPQEQEVAPLSRPPRGGPARWVDSRSAGCAGRGAGDSEGLGGIERGLCV